MTKMVPINHEDPIIRAFMLFTQLAGATIKYMDSGFFREGNLSLIKYMVLKSLTLNGGTMKHSDLAKWTNTKKHNITTLVDRMKEDHLVTTEHSLVDRRVNNVILTDKGRKTYLQATPVARRMVKQLMQNIEVKDALDFEKLLKVLKENIENNT